MNRFSLIRCALFGLVGIAAGQSARAALVTRSINVTRCYHEYVQMIQDLNAFRDVCPSLSMQVRHGLGKDYASSCFNVGTIVASLTFDNSDSNCVGAFNGLATGQFEITQPDPAASNGQAFTYKFIRRTDPKVKGSYEMGPTVFIGVLDLIQGDYQNNISRCTKFVEEHKSEAKVEVKNASTGYTWERLAPDRITKMNETGSWYNNLMEACVQAATSHKVW